MYLMITFSIHYMVGKCIRIENQFLNNSTIIFVCMDIIYMHTYIYQFYLEKRKEMVILFSTTPLRGDIALYFAQEEYDTSLESSN